MLLVRKSCGVYLEMPAVRTLMGREGALLAFSTGAVEWLSEWFDPLGRRWAWLDITGAQWRWLDLVGLGLSCALY